MCPGRLSDDPVRLAVGPGMGVRGPRDGRGRRSLYRIAYGTRAGVSDISRGSARRQDHAAQAQDHLVQVRTDREIEGWVDRLQLERTLDPSGERMHVQEATAEDYARRRWEAGVMGGEFDGANEISVYGAYAMTRGLSAELSLSQVLGEFSESMLFGVDLLAQPFPDWRFSPFFALGTGVIDTNPRTVLVQAQDRNDRMSHVGIGLRTYLSRRFMLRMRSQSRGLHQPGR